MKKITIIAFILTSYMSYSQKLTSIVDSSTRREMIKTILKNRKTAPFEYLYSYLNNSTKIIRVFHAAVYASNKDTVTFKYDLYKNLEIGDRDFLLYNLANSDSASAFAEYFDDKSENRYLYPSLDLTESFLNDVRRYYDLDKVVFLALSGVPGLVVMVDNVIWVIDGNTRTDLNTYVKEYYPKLDEFRNIFLVYKPH
jgi:hypothetical protein